MSDTNKLNFLIPTGEHDIAVREILVKIFGDAISCKVPGMPCGEAGSDEFGALASSVFQVFNGGTLIFVMIMLIFIGMFAFTKTALDGEFMGKTWNTTFSALRLIAGVGFLLPLPNGYSTIQNFAMYVGLWGSGLGNETTKAVSEHYLKRLQKSMIEREPQSGSVGKELRQIFSMHVCAKYLNSQGSSLQLQTINMGAGTQATETYVYRENGENMPFGSTPCGKFTVSAYVPAAIYSDSDRGGVWGSAFNGDPLTSSARNQMKALSDELSKSIRDVKTKIITDSMNENSGLAQLADGIVQKYNLNQVQIGADGSVTSAPASETILSAAQATAFIESYVQYEYAQQRKIEQSLKTASEKISTASTATGSGSFFYNAQQMLNNGGWMNTAATYRTMLDMVSLSFINPTAASPYKLVPPSEQELAFYSEYGASNSAQKVADINTLVGRVLDSETAKTALRVKVNGTTADDQAKATVEVPNLTTESLLQIVKSDLSPSKAMGQIYGDNFTNGFRNSIIRGLSISADADPLFQIKSIGDFVTMTAEILVVGELTARTLIAVVKTGKTALSSNVVGKAVNFVTGAGDTADAGIEGVRYILEGIFTGMKAMTLAMLALGYLFSTWLPSLPYVSFLMAQLGWLFGLVMTLFALNIWGVMHVTPARNDSFIGSEAQGYLMLVSLFFRPAISVAALALSYVVAPPIMKLVNMTLIPMMYTNNNSTNMISAIFGTLFCLFLYFSVAKGVLVMIYTIPQSFPDEVMKIINAGMSDLGASAAKHEMSSGGHAAAAAITTAGSMSKAGGEHLKATLERREKSATDKANAAALNQDVASGAKSNDSAGDIGGAAAPSHNHGDR
jgi:hypothetical protein